MEIYLPQVPNSGVSNQNSQSGYTVQPGDTLESIAAQFGINLEELIAANFPDGVAGEISPGQELNIPLGNDVGGLIDYTSQQGDTQETVASQFQIGTKDLLRANPALANSSLFPGSLLKIPQLTTSNTEKSNLPDNYTMKLGDSLAELAKRYGVPTEDLQKVNPEITDINKHYPGKLIKFPQNKTLESTNKDSQSPAIAFDNFSKLRFQMMGAPKLQPELSQPGFGMVPSQIDEREEDTQESGKRKQPNIPAPFDKWAEYIYLAAEKYNLAASLIAAVIWYESGGNNIIGKNGHGCGLMQIDARRHSDWLQTHQQGLEPATNIDFGASLLKKYLDHFKNDTKLALAAYSVGTEAVELALRSNLPDMVGSRYAFDILSQQEYFKRFFED